MLAAAYESLLLTFFAGCVAVWGSLAWRWFHRLPILPRSPRTAVPWGLFDLLLAFGLYVCLSLVAVSLVPIEREPANAPTPAADETAVAEAESEHASSAKAPQEKLTLRGWRTMIALDGSVKLLAMALLMVILTLRYGGAIRDVGFSLKHLAEDIQIGLITFLAIYAPTIALQAALVLGLDWKYDHPLIESVAETKDVLLFALAAIAAGFVAPLSEEFMFRGLLQGWLEKVFAGRAMSEQLLMGGEDEMNFVKALQNDEADESLEESSAAAKPYVEATSRDWLAIVISMTVFSLLHYSHGPAWIPLLLLGAAIGFVYQRTHRLWPGIIAHLLLNMTTILGLWVQVFEKQN